MPCKTNDVKARERESERYTVMDRSLFLNKCATKMCLGGKKKREKKKDHCAARTMSVKLDILHKQVFITATITHTLSSTIRRELKATDCLSISPELY